MVIYRLPRCTHDAPAGENCTEKFCGQIADRVPGSPSFRILAGKSQIMLLVLVDKPGGTHWKTFADSFQLQPP